MEDRGITLQAEDAVGPAPLHGFWESRLAPFLEKYCLLLCVCLAGVACCRIISTYNALSVTADEPIHFACGLEYVANHVYQIETQHPPLSRMMEALGPYFLGAQPLDDASYPRVSDQMGIEEIIRTGNVDRTVFMMRLGNLPFFLLACLVVGGWSRYLFGKPIAVLAVGLFSLLPTMLADAGLATTDMALGATVGAAFLSAILWAEKPTVLRSLLLAFCTAMACLSKFTALGYLPVAGALALASYLVLCRPSWRGLWGLAKQRLATLILAVCITALLIWAGYWFSVGPVVFHGIDFRKVPAPEFFEGIRAALNHNREGHGAFLFGEFRWRGWWYYFPVALAVKTPIAFLILLAFGTLVCLRKWKQLIYLIPLAFSLGILLPAMDSQVDIGIRHVEPIYIGLSIMAALGLKQLLQWARTGAASALTAGVLLAWMTISVAVHHPDYLAYFNGFAGKAPEKILVDSNYDWGQDLKLLATRLRQLGVKEFSLAPFDGVPLAIPEHNNILETWYGVPSFKELKVCGPSPGWNVLSTTIEQSLSRWPGYEFYRGSHMATPWYEQIAPTERVGPLLLYNVPPSTAQRYCLAGTD